MLKRKTGLWMILLSGILFGIMPGLIQFCYSQGASLAEVNTAKFLVMILVLLPYIFTRRAGAHAFLHNAPRLLLLSVFSVSTEILLFSSYHYLDTSLATTIHFLYPVIVSFISLLFLHKKANAVTWICLVLSVGGIVAMLKSGGSLHPAGFILVSLSAVTWAIYIVLLSTDFEQELTPLEVVFSIAVINLVLQLLFGIATDSIHYQLSFKAWIGILLNGLLSGAGGSLLFSLGTQRCEAQVAAIASTMEPIVSVFVGIFFLNEPKSTRVLIGCALILASVILLAAKGENDK